MNLILAHLESGGWECVVKGCHGRFEGRHDAELHAERDHGAEPFMDPEMDIYDVKELAKEMA